MKTKQQIAPNDIQRRKLKDKVKKLDRAEHDLDELRLEIGRDLVLLRPLWPKSGPNAGGWSRLLEGIGLSRQRAWELMVLAGYVDEHADEDSSAGGRIASLRESGARGSAPAEIAPSTPTNRDAWCTPEDLCDELPLVDLDPCSNPRSRVRAKKTYSLEAGQNGILLPWFGLVFVNGPYSDLMPWAQKLDVDRKKVGGCGFLVNADHSPEWWKLLTRHLRIRLDFNVRLEFIPPPGVEPSKNDRPQSLLMDEPFWAKCKQTELLDRGQLWRRA